MLRSRHLELPSSCREAGLLSTELLHSTTMAEELAHVHRSDHECSTFDNQYVSRESKLAGEEVCLASRLR
jgi:hypothetical protein